MATCKYTGFEFSGRGKNHPAIREFLKDASANKTHRGAFAEAKRLLGEAKGNFDTPEALADAVEAAWYEWLETGAESKTVKTWREREAAAARKIAYMERRQPGAYEEATDGNALSWPE